jgi:hypothetical protein
MRSILGTIQEHASRNARRGGPAVSDHALASAFPMMIPAIGLEHVPAGAGNN